MNKDIIRHGFVLILLALITGLFVQAMAIPRLGLSAHTIGIFSGVLLIGIGAVWPLFTLTVLQKQVLYWTWLYSSYINWLGCLTGAVLGAGKITPIAAAGVVGPPFAEALVGILLISVAIVSFVAVGLSIYGLRGRAASSA